MADSESIYRSVSSMEPLLPGAIGERLADLSVGIFEKSGELKSSLPSVAVRGEVAKLVREMNSYYSNLIEGHKTLPRDIERALREDFSDDEDDHRNQRLSVAHIRAEEAMRERLSRESGTDVYGAEFVCWLHHEFYSHIPEEDWFTTSRKGKRQPLVPGVFRDYNVDVGRHVPPDHVSLGDFLERYRSFCFVWRGRNPEGRFRRFSG